MSKKNIPKKDILRDDGKIRVYRSHTHLNVPREKKIENEELHARQIHLESQVAKTLDYGRIYWAKIEEFNPDADKPLIITRKGEILSCYVTENLKDLYQSNKLKKGNIILFCFVDGNPDQACAFAKTLT